jgi:hypothetical protein
MRTAGMPLCLILGFCAAALISGCAKLSGSNVGAPSAQVRMEFSRNLALIRPGMPADSLEMIFRTVEKAGQAGILSRVLVRMDDTERVRYKLGWRSDPKHQTGVKSSDDLDVEIATVLAINDELVSIEKHPQP